MTTARYLIYGRPTSSNVMKVLVVVEECGVDVEIEHASGWLAPGSNLYPVGFGEGDITPPVAPLPSPTPPARTHGVSYHHR